MKALLIDDRTFILAAFQAELLAFDSHVTLVNVESARGARHALATGQRFDFILLDLQPVNDNAFDILAELVHSHPATPVVAISAGVTNSDIVRAVYLGARAIVRASAGGAALLHALRTVASGRMYLPPVIEAREAAGGSSTRRSISFEAFAPRVALSVSANARAPFTSLGLTPRQLDVLALLLHGQSNKLIARALNLSVDTIKDHVAAVMRTLKVKSRSQAVLAISGPTQGTSDWRLLPKSASRKTALAALAMPSPARRDADLGRVTA